MSFWDSLMNAFKQGGNNSYGAGGGSAGSLLKPKGYKKARSTSQGKPSNNKANRDRSNRAASRRYQGQANLHKKRVAAERKKSIPFTGRAVSSGGGGGDVGGYDDGSAAMQEVLDQIGSMRTPDVEIPQIDVAKTLAGLFNPQFKAIDQEVGRTKKEGSRNSKEIKAAYKALEKSIDTEDAAEIKKSYKQATKENNSAGKSAEKSMTSAMKAQAAERRKDAESLGIETALAQDSGAQTELAKGISDAAKSTQSQNARLSELKKADEVLNRDAAQSAAFQGNESVSALKAQVAEVLAGLGTRRLDTKAARANKKLELQTQNQNAVNAGKDAQAKEAQAMMQAQVDLMKNAQDMGLENAKLQSRADIEEAKLANKRYEVDARYANGGSGNSKDKGSVLDQLVALRPGGLGAKSIQGVISNMDSFYASGKGTWSDAYKQYAKTYSKSERSKSAAREYLRLMGKR